MEVKKAVKKVLAIGTGATMFGATVLSAMAASTLADFPAPFVDNGKFNAFIVVGDKAAAEDVVGAVDIGAAMQFDLRKQSAVSVGAPTATVSEGWKIEKGGNKLTLGKNLADVQDTPVSQSELPGILSDGKYSESKGSNSNDVTYTQQIRLLNSTIDRNFRFDQPYYPSPGRTANTYVHFSSTSTSPVYSYVVTFSDDIKYDNSSSATVRSDIETTTVRLQGRDYTIIKAGTLSGTNELDSVELLAGQTLIWATQNQPFTKTVDGVDHDIEVYDVNDQATSCGVKIDGVLVWLDKGETQTINGVQVGVSDLKTVHAQLQDVDVCQLNVGANKVQILEGQQVKVDGKSLVGSTGTFGTSTSSLWRTINVTYAATNIIDLAPGQAFIDPVFKSWKIAYAGNSARAENISVNTGGITGNIVFKNQDGKTIDLPITQSSNSFSSTASIYPGWYFNQPILWQAGQTATFQSGAGDITSVGILATSSGGQAHLLKIQSIDTYNNRTTIYDYTYDRLYENKGGGGTDNRLTISSGDIDAGTINSIDLGGFGTLGLTIRETRPGASIWDSVTLNTTTSIPLDDNRTKTQYMPSARHNGFLDLRMGNLTPIAGTGTSGANYTNVIWNVSSSSTTLQGASGADGPFNVGTYVLRVVFNEEQPTGTSLAAAATSTDSGAAELQITFGLNNNTQQITVQQPSNLTSVPSSATVGLRRISPTNSDVQIGYTHYGTKQTWDQKNTQYLYLEYPDDPLFANVFIAPIAAEVSTVAGSVNTVTLDKLNVGAARLASEITDVKAQNLILVGGPCANKATADVMGVAYATAGCEAGFTDGSALIKLYDTGSGNMALVVAGSQALDTRAATRVIANHDAYATDLKGTEVAVTYTSLSNIQVSTPSS